MFSTEQASSPIQAAEFVHNFVLISPLPNSNFNKLLWVVSSHCACESCQALIKYSKVKVEKGTIGPTMCWFLQNLSQSKSMWQTGMLCLQKQKQATNGYIHIARRKKKKSGQTFLYSQICKLVMWHQIKFARVARVTVQFVQCAFSSKQ